MIFSIFFFRYTYVINLLIPANFLPWVVLAVEFVLRNQKEIFILKTEAMAMAKQMLMMSDVVKVTTGYIGKQLLM